jgi:uroporphyrinogen-III decarboxylase
MTIAEDMSYNNGPMISKGLMDEFMSPYYAKLLEKAKQMDMLTIVDTDGDVTMLVPWLLENGIEGVLPLERQAGVDGMALREMFPKLRMVGHYDKMVMPHGEAAMRAEFERLLPLMGTGGFIPSVDHQTPPGVSLENYRTYLRLLHEYLP